MTPSQCAQTLIDLITEEASGLDHIGRTIVARRIMGVLSGWVPKDKGTDPGPGYLPPMTDKEAKAFGVTAILFGKFSGTRYDEVDADYLRWLADASREMWHNLHRYLRSKRIATEEDDG